MSRSRFVQFLVFSCLPLGVASSAEAQNFTDKFELKPFWTINDQNGSVSVAADISHGGESSLRLSSRPGGQVNVWVSHVYPTPRKGTLSVWFHDTTAGSATLYSGLYAGNSTKASDSFAVNVADWNGTHYIWSGPGVSETPTTVPRSNGWHEFKLQITATGFEASIDGVVVGSVVGDFNFDTVYLLLQGPSSHPNGTFFFDDFRVRVLK
jgi:hypothetical protein